MEHFYVKFGDPSCIAFEISCVKNRQRKAGENPTPVTAVTWVNILHRTIQRLRSAMTVTHSLTTVHGWPSQTKTALTRARTDHFSVNNDKQPTIETLSIAESLQFRQDAAH